MKRPPPVPYALMSGPLMTERFLAWSHGHETETGYWSRMEARCAPGGNSPTGLHFIVLGIDPASSFFFQFKQKTDYCCFLWFHEQNTHCLYLLCDINRWCGRHQYETIEIENTHLWLSWEPRRLDIVSSKFWRRSRTFCTVRFLWDSGSEGQSSRTKRLWNILVSGWNSRHTLLIHGGLCVRINERINSCAHKIFLPPHARVPHHLCLDRCDRCRLCWHTASGWMLTSLSRQISLHGLSPW